MMILGDFNLGPEEEGKKKTGKRAGANVCKFLRPSSDVVLLPCRTIFSN